MVDLPQVNQAIDGLPSYDRAFLIFNWERFQDALRNTIPDVLKNTAK
jgi:hypothetical protein